MTTRVIPEELTGRQLRATYTARAALEAMGAEVVDAAFTNFWCGISTQKVYGPEPFTWGRVLKVHEVGPYSIVEHKSSQAGNVSDEDYAASEPNISFSCFVDGYSKPNGWRGSRDLGRSCGSLDAALITCIAFWHEQMQRGHGAAINSDATGYILRMIGADHEGE